MFRISITPKLSAKTQRNANPPLIVLLRIPNSWPQEFFVLVLWVIRWMIFLVDLIAMVLPLLSPLLSEVHKK